MRVALGQGDVPGNLLAELRVMAEFRLLLGEEDVYGRLWGARQQSEQRSVLLNGMGADDGEPLHEPMTDSMA